MGNNKILIELEYLAKILKECYSDKETIRNVLNKLINDNSTESNHKSQVNEIINQLFDKPEVELSEFEKLLQKAVNFNPKKI